MDPGGLKGGYIPLIIIQDGGSVTYGLVMLWPLQDQRSKIHFKTVKYSIIQYNTVLGISLAYPGCSSYYQLLVFISKNISLFKGSSII